ncbi:MAG: CoA transferase [Chloroflexi bacterium]|nr:CoA transferase [Chloroflexota bacterium]
MAPAGSDPPRALEGVRVVECGVAIAGPLAGRYLAHLGADVIKVESRSRSAAMGARMPAWAPPGVGLAGGDMLAGNNTFNAQKRGVGLELKSPEGRDLLDQIIEQSDVFLTNFSVPAINSLQIDYEHVRAVNPDIIYVSMPGYGSGEGPYRDYKSWGPNLSSFSGLDYLTGDPDRQPAMTPVPLPDYIAGYHAVTAIISALLHRQQSGDGQWIDISQFESAVACLGPYIGQVSLGGEEPNRSGNRSPGAAPRGVFPTIDDDRWVAISARNDDEWRSLAHAIGRPEWADDARFQTFEGRRAHEDAIEAGLAEWSARRTREEAAFVLQAAGVAAAPVQDHLDHLADPQLRARNFWRLVRHRWLDGDLIDGLPIHLDETPAVHERASPALGEHNGDILIDFANLSLDRIDELAEAGAVSPAADDPPGDATLERPYFDWALPLLRKSRSADLPHAPPRWDSGRAIRDMRDARTRHLMAVATRGREPRISDHGPLHGTRVVDLSDGMSAYGTRLLAHLGADVVRVEPPEGASLRADGPFADDRSLLQLYMDSGKRSVTLALDDPADAEAFAELCASADLVYSADEDAIAIAEAAREANPMLSTVAVTPFGLTGPYRAWAADDLTLWALSGLLQLTGYPDRRPLIPGALLADYFVGEVGAIAALATLYARTHTGRGQLADVSAHEVLLSTAQGGTGLPTLIEDANPRRRTGSSALGSSPYGYYTCSDRLVCLLALTVGHWDALASWIDEETHAEGVLDERFRASSMVRKQYDDEVQAYVDGLAGRYDADTFCKEAQRRGIPAAPVNPTGAMLRDPHLEALDYWSDAEQPGLGRIRWPGAPFRMSATPWAPASPAPEAGQHNADLDGGVWRPRGDESANPG